MIIITLAVKVREVTRQIESGIRVLTDGKAFCQDLSHGLNSSYNGISFYKS